MKRLTLIICALLFALFPACANGSATTGGTMNITLTIGEKTFAATLSDTATTRALAGKFPLAVDMSELNGNEYYVYLDSSLPTASKNPRTIHAGDIKLYGANCLVIFYKSFNTNYSYTDLGTVSDTAGLLDALKANGGKVTFSLAE